MKTFFLHIAKVLLLLSIAHPLAFAADVADDKPLETKDVGEPVVRKYLSADGTSTSSEATTTAGDSEEKNSLTIMAGTFANSTTYEWNGAKRTGVGQNNYSLTYLFENWHDIDVNFRGEITEFQLGNERPSKLSLLPLFTLPLAETRFPWYFGMGVGAGIFLRQVDGYSPLSVDYQVVTGLRFPKLVENAGLALEVGIKNHLLLLSSGQFNALAVDVGAVFVF